MCQHRLVLFPPGLRDAHSSPLHHLDHVLPLLPETILGRESGPDGACTDGDWERGTSMQSLGW